MSCIRFEWDSRMAKSNEGKHRVTFSEGETVFYDDNAIEFPDPDHSQDEDRFVMIGMSAALRLLVVCYCFGKTNQAFESYLRARQQKRKPVFTEGMFDEKRIQFFENGRQKEPLFRASEKTGDHAVGYRGH